MAYGLLNQARNGNALSGQSVVMRRNRGFTLIELMIVVAIIGILAAVAITNFRMFQLRTKMSEARVNVNAISRAETAYFSEFSTYLSAASTPGGALTVHKRPWAGGGAADFDTIGYFPEGQVHFNYGVDINAIGTAFTVGAAGDLDGDTVTSDVGYVHRAAGVALGLPSTVALGCIGAGVYDPGNPLGLFDTVGVCALLDGRTEF